MAEPPTKLGRLIVSQAIALRQLRSSLFYPNLSGYQSTKRVAKWATGRQRWIRIVQGKISETIPIQLVSVTNGDAT